MPLTEEAMSRLGQCEGGPEREQLERLAAAPAGGMIHRCSAAPIGWMDDVLQIAVVWCHNLVHADQVHLLVLGDVVVASISRGRLWRRHVVVVAHVVHHCKKGAPFHPETSEMLDQMKNGNHVPMTNTI
jgi:hypothetical protein